MQMNCLLGEQARATSIYSLGCHMMAAVPGLPALLPAHNPGLGLPGGRGSRPRVHAHHRQTGAVAEPLTWVGRSCRTPVQQQACPVLNPTRGHNSSRHSHAGGRLAGAVMAGSGVLVASGKLAGIRPAGAAYGAARPNTMDSAALLPSARRSRRMRTSILRG